MSNTIEQSTDALNLLVADPILEVESPLERALELVGDKYSFLIIHILNQFQPQRFVELEEQINGISPRTLSARLKHLYRYGIIERHQFPTIPPRVEYRLTEKGQAIASFLSELSGWANTWFPYQPK